MKAILEFNLEDQDDRLEHERCIKSTDMALVLWHFQNNTRKEIERKIESIEDRGMNVTPYDVIEFLYDELQQLLDEHNVRPDSLIV